MKTSLVVTVTKKHNDSWLAYCKNNDLKAKFVAKEEKSVKYQFESEQDAQKARAWAENLVRFDKLEGNLP